MPTTKADARRRTGGGFTLPELLLVLTVILAFGVLAMPRLYDARRADNEA